MECRVISSSESGRWEAAINGIPHSYAHRLDYCVAMAGTSGVDTSLYLCEENGERIVCPLNIRSKEDGYRELVSPYGMGGIIASEDAWKMDRLMKGWLDSARENGFVTCYIMQHPLFQLSKGICEGVIDHNIQYLIDLSLDIDAIWSNMSKAHRYEIRNFKNSTDIKISTDKNEMKRHLLDLYPKTVERVKASRVYHFSQETLEQLTDISCSLLIAVEDTTGVQAVSLYLYTPWVADYFINASSTEGRKYSRLLVWKAVEIFKSMNIPYLNLGGGVKPGDTLDHFKRRFGGKTINTNAVRHIFDINKFHHLNNKYGRPESGNTTYFPPYWMEKGGESDDRLRGNFG